ncbi:MAG: hypothetical protein WCY15_09990 [Phenylobacterium sp.]|uniref:hypothetical protein n=1 Tax=Phenylobacterium sp. TaxID=1871053 RepID=UPI00355D5EA4
MSSSPARRPSRRAATEVSIKLGAWLEAHATGWGVLVVGLVALAVLAVAGLTALA